MASLQGFDEPDGAGSGEALSPTTIGFMRSDGRRPTIGFEPGPPDPLTGLLVDDDEVSSPAQLPQPAEEAMHATQAARFDAWSEARVRRLFTGAS